MIMEITEMFIDSRRRLTELEVKRLASSDSCGGGGKEFLLTGITFLAQASIALLAAAQLGCVGIGGETIRLDHEPLQTSASSSSAGFVSLVQPAEDMRSDRSCIGRATITLFAISSGNIQSQELVTDAVVRNVEDALRAAGYEVVMGNRAELLGGEGTSRPSPAVVVIVDELYFKNYNWLWPYVPTWGDIGLTIEVWTPENERIYQRTVSGGGSSYRISGNSAFTKATRSAMTEVLQELVGVFSSEEFRLAAVLSAEEEAARNAVATEATPLRSVTERLLELNRLRDDGLITEEMYERMRREILEEL